VNRYHKRSERSLCRLLLELNGESYYYHQTLTFHPVTWNYEKAKRTLNRLLDNLHHQFDMACVYTAGRHKSQGLHFHAAFYFFPDTQPPFFPSRMQCDFRAAVFSAWDRYSEDSLMIAERGSPLSLSALKECFQLLARDKQLTEGFAWTEEATRDKSPYALVGYSKVIRSVRYSEEPSRGASPSLV